MTKIRVMFLIGSLGSGGSERQVVGCLQRLDRSRFEPFLFTVYPGGALANEVPGDVEVFSYWGKHHPPRLNFPGLIHGRQRRELERVLASVHADAVYERNFEMTLLGAAAVRRRPTHRVSIISSDPKSDLRENAGRFSVMKRLLLRKAYRQADRVVAVSDGVAQAACSYYSLKPGRVTTIHNSVDVECLRARAAESMPPSDPQRFRLIAVGRLVPPKGYRFLLEAVGDVVRQGRRQVHLSIIGEGELRSELESYVRQAGLAEHVELLGFLPNPLPHVRHAQLYCLSSVYEGMPNSLLEAMACGTPVLATDCPSGPAELLEKGRLGGLVPAGDSKALSSAILNAIDNYSAWVGRTEAAREHVERKFSLSASVRKLEELLTQVCQR